MRQHILIFFVCLFISWEGFSTQSEMNLATTADQYNLLAQQYDNEMKYEEAEKACFKSLKLKPENGIAFYLLSHIYQGQKKWEKAIEFGEKGIKSEPGFIPAYSNLFYGYVGAKKWKEALKQGEITLQKDTQTDISPAMEEVKKSIANEGRSTFFIVVMILLLGAALFYPIYLESKKGVRVLNESSKHFTWIESILISGSVSFLIWQLFYAFSSKIWSTNSTVFANDFTPYLKAFVFEKDGFESFALYVGMFLTLGLSLIFSYFLLKLKLTKKGHNSALICMLAVTVFYFCLIGFHPPMPELGIGLKPVNFIIPMIVGLFSIGTYFMHKKYSRITWWLLVIVTGFCSLIPYGPSSTTDLTFILAPALRLMHGFSISEIYFQYDLLLSFLAFSWMKMNLSLQLFPMIGSLSFFLFFVGIYWFGEKFFLKKGLTIFLIIALLIVRFYAVGYEVIFQVSPLRLDLWLILILVAYKKGTSHWLLGISVGLLVLLHRNLGLIYMISYLELLALLFLFDFVECFKSKQTSTIPQIIISHLKKNAINLVIIAISLLCCYFFFGGLFSDAATLYRQLGFGMLPIEPTSFYWYMPIVFSSVVVLLYYCKKKLSERYFSVALFIILLAIGNSMYFFGRSHENNILNISGILILAIFILFDLLTVASVTKPLEIPIQKGKKAKAASTSFVPSRTLNVLALPLAFVLISSFYYSTPISNKIGKQFSNLKQLKFSEPLNYETINLEIVKALTQQSQNVFFLNWRSDFFHYYEGHYKPLGYFNPLSSWIYKKDLTEFLQDLLDKHYYLVLNAKTQNEFSDILINLHYNRSKENNGVLAISKENISLVLPNENALFHAGIKDNLGSSWIDYPSINLNNSFTTELLIKPTGKETENGTILTNLTQNGGASGFTIQKNANIPNQYVFGYGNGKQISAGAMFNLENNVWNYLSISMNKTSVLVYNNGKLISTTNHSDSLMESSSPITLGNVNGGGSPFVGEIKEVKISKGKLDEKEVLGNWEKVRKSTSQPQ